MKKIGFAFAVAALAVAGCKSSVEKEKAHYMQVRDRLDALATKMPAMKADIQAKEREFDAAEKDGETKKGQAAIDAIRGVTTRAEAYEKALVPVPGQPPAPGAVPTPTPAAGGSKIGATTPTPPPPSGSGFGGGAAASPPPATPPPPPPSGSGFGGH